MRRKSLKVHGKELGVWINHDDEKKRKRQSSEAIVGGSERAPAALQKLRAAARVVGVAKVGWMEPVQIWRAPEAKVIVVVAAHQDGNAVSRRGEAGLSAGLAALDAQPL